MVKITQVHTGSGDSGNSSLVDGTRRSKADIRFEMVGTCDELNSIIGICLMEVARLESLHEDGGPRGNVPRVQNLVNLALTRIQSELFDLGAELACPADKIPEYMQLIGEHQSSVLLSEMEEMLEECEPLNSFILPGGIGPIAHFHHARCVTRRLERTMVHLKNQTPSEVSDISLQYVNRLSDWFFVIARFVSKRMMVDEVLWLPLGKRGPEEGISVILREQRMNDDFSGL